MAQAEADFPLQFSVDYPDRDLNRLTTAFRIFTVITDSHRAGHHQRGA